MDFDTVDGRANCWKKLFLNRLGIKIKTIQEDNKVAISVKNSEDFRNMPCYPLNGSIKVIDEIIVIKFE